MIDIEDDGALRAYLARRFPELDAASTHDRAVTTQSLRGGVSNRTVLVQLPSGDRWVVKQALERLRVPVEWRCSPERVHREALGMQLLRGLLPRGTVPGLVFEDRPNHLIAMEAVREPFENWKSLLLAGRLAPGEIRSFARILAGIHRGGWRVRERLPPELADLTYFRNLRLEPYYRYTAERLPEAAPLLVSLADDYERERHTLVHGDFSPKNILLRRGRMILLDHEVIHIGDPAFDLGFALTHLLSKAHHLPAHRRVFLGAARAFFGSYLKSVSSRTIDGWGASFEQRAVNHTLGCLLARAAGRSQLEYLSAEEKARQIAAVLSLVDERTAGIEELVTRFAGAIEERE